MRGVSGGMPRIALQRVQGDLHNDDRATGQTVRIMCGHVAESVNDPVVQQVAQSCLDTAAANGRANDPRAICAAIWWKVKHSIRFASDDAAIWRLLNERDQLELLISPAVMVRMESPQGDCDDFSMMAAALLKCCGLGYEIVTVAADHSQPSRYSHVFCRAVLPDGRRVAMDCSHGKFPGWQVPVEDTLRLQVWDEAGNPISDAAPRARLQGYSPGRGLGACSNPYQDDSGTWVCLDTASPVPTSSTGTSPWTSLAASLANQWTQIGGRILAPTTIVQRSPSGAISMETPGASPSLLTSFGTAASAGGSSLLLWGGVAVVAVIGLAAMSRGRR